MVPRISPSAVENMSESITSFDDYVEQLTRKLRSLRHFERCIFSVWCAEYLLKKHDELVKQDLSESVLKTLQEILDELWEDLLSGSIPNTAKLNYLDEILMGIGPEDPIPAIEVHPVVTMMESCLGIGILGCRRNDVHLAQKAGEFVVDVLDFELDERDDEYASYSFSTMFTHPEISEELKTQLAMIKHLWGDYSLESSLRSAFR